VNDRGTVNARLEAILPLRLRGPSGTVELIECVVDTGYTGSLTLPLHAIRALDLTRSSGGRATLADGSIRRFDTYSADIFWNGTWTEIIVSAVGNEALLGMTLIAGRGLWVEAIPSGNVEVRSLHPTS
jgi:clan AA aspartic protease